MPIHALLGATGSTGGAVLQYLLDEPQPNLELRVFVRNKSKLLKSFPSLEQNTTAKIVVTEGNLDDTPAMQQSFKDATVIYDCIGSNDSVRGTTTVQDSASAVLAALRALKKSQGASFQRPTILVNRSQTINEDHIQTGGFMRNLVHAMLYYCYDDIAKAVEIFRAGGKDEQLCQLICVDPPALHAGGKRTGHELKLAGNTYPSLNYVDLGAAFVEIAKRKQEFIGKGVLVGATGDVEEHWDVLRGYLLRGVRARILGF